MNILRGFAVAVVALASTVAFSGLAGAATVSIGSEDSVNYPTTSSPTPWASFIGSVANQTGSVEGQWRSPWQNIDESHIAPYHDTLSYTSIQMDSSAVYNFATPMDTLALLWGSPDSYNQIEFFSDQNASGLLATFSGAELAHNIANPTGVGHDLVSLLLSGGFFESVRLSSIGKNAFEFTNLTASCSECAVEPVPIPGALPLFLSGFGVIAYVARRRKQKKQAA
jgi:hypothetical protein